MAWVLLRCWWGVDELDQVLDGLLVSSKKFQACSEFCLALLGELCPLCFGKAHEGLSYRTDFFADQL